MEGMMRQMTEGLKAAQVNLARVLSGQVAISQLRAAERKADEAERRRKLAEIRKQEQAGRRRLKEELKELTQLCNFYDRKLTKGTLTAEERGAYEEVDHRREQLMEELDPHVWSW